MLPLGLQDISSGKCKIHVHPGGAQCLRSYEQLLPGHEGIVQWFQNAHGPIMIRFPEKIMKWLGRSSRLAKALLPLYKSYLKGRPD